jgi:hypothetical protein
MQQKIHYCRCRINLAGQNCHTVILDEHNPVTWPEVQVLTVLHGEENVMDIMPIGIGDTWPTAEKNRLIAIYGHRVVESCFPGRNFRMEYMMTEETNLPHYTDGKVDADFQLAAPKPPPEKPAEPAKPPPPPVPGDDHDDGEDEDVQSAAPLPPPMPKPLDPIFKPGRNKVPETHKGA